MRRVTSDPSSKEEKRKPLSAILSKLSKNELIRRDVLGRTILHIIILCNRPDLLKHLLRNPEVKSLLPLIDYESGWNCLHLCIYHKRINCFRVILDHLKNNFSESSSGFGSSILIDLLKAKDRNRITPLQLLDNDFKDLLWIPTYIDETGRYHLEYRFSKFNPAHDKTATDEANTLNQGKLGSRRHQLKTSHSWWNELRGGSDIYICGSNKNNNLGLGDSTDRLVPTRLAHDDFKDFDLSYKDIQSKLCKPRFSLLRMSKNHSVILTKDGCLYSCGIGSRGRLGHGSDNNDLFRFKKIRFFESLTDDEFGTVSAKSKKVCTFDISAHHTVALTTNNEIFTWGYNNYCQLGYSATSLSGLNGISQESYEGYPKQVSSGELRKNGAPINGIRCSKIHSLAYTKNEIYFWGLCIGQMGIPFDSSKATIDYKIDGSIGKGFIQSTPRKVALRDDIKCLLTCETTTCLVTTSNDIHVYFKFQHFKLPKVPIRELQDKHFDIFKPSILTEGIVIKKVSVRSHSFIAVLLESGDVLGFSLNDLETMNANASKAIRNIKYSNIWSSYDKDMKAVDVETSMDGSVIICTRNGSVFVKNNSLSILRRKSSVTDLSAGFSSNKSKFKKLDGLSKIVNVTCDENFSSFGFIRDDIDLLPLKLKPNTFLQDMQYTSVLRDDIVNRKQDELFNTSNNINSYITDFIYPFTDSFNSVSSDSMLYQLPGKRNFNEEEEEDILSSHSLPSNDSDLLLAIHSRRHERSQHIRTRPMSTYLLPSKEDEKNLYNLLKNSSQYLYSIFIDNYKDIGPKCVIFKFSEALDIFVPIQKGLLLTRTSVFREVLESKVDDFLIEKGSIKGIYKQVSNEFIFTSKINFKSFLIFAHYLCTNRVLSIWDDYPSGANCPSDIKSIKKDFDNLIEAFCHSFSHNALYDNAKFVRDVVSMLEQDDSGDLTLYLRDGTTKCSAQVLSSRCAYFETILSDRWSSSSENKTLNLNSITKRQFDIVLLHLYGLDDFSILNHFSNDIHSFADVDMFINHMLELVEIADELLLFNLKSLCELAVKDLITQENVLTILFCSYNLGAKKIFMNCCWYIYNTLDSILLDPVFEQMSHELTSKIEEHINYFRCCKFIGFGGLLQDSKMILSDQWMVNRSQQLVSSFIFNLNEFNELFMTDRKGFSSFEPLVDLKQDGVNFSSGAKKRKESKPSVQPESSKLTSEAPNSFILSFRNSFKESSSNNEYAVEDDDESNKAIDKGGFSFVLKQRKKSQPHLTKLGVSPNENKAKKDRVMTNDNERQRSEGSITFTSEASNSGIMTDATINAGGSRKLSLGSKTNWADKNTVSTDLDEQPVLGEQIPSKGGQDAVKKASRPKLKPVTKLSQKERKRLTQSSSNSLGEAKPAPSSNPWASSLPTGSKGQQDLSEACADNSVPLHLPKLGNGNTAKQFPTLGTVKKSDRAQSSSQKTYSQATSVNREINRLYRVYATPSLLQIKTGSSSPSSDDSSRDGVPRTLQEIQEEQKFIKWWEEEAARVQHAMKLKDKMHKRQENNEQKKERKVRPATDSGGRRGEKPGKGKKKTTPFPKFANGIETNRQSSN